MTTATATTIAMIASMLPSSTAKAKEQHCKSQRAALGDKQEKGNGVVVVAVVVAVVDVGCCC